MSIASRQFTTQLLSDSSDPNIIHRNRPTFSTKVFEKFNVFSGSPMANCSNFNLGVIQEILEISTVFLSTIPVDKAEFQVNLPRP